MSALKEEEKKKIDEEPNGSFPSLGTAAKKCVVVITDWDPQPGASLGRMSLNPTIEKLNEEPAITGGKTDASPASSSSNGGRMSFSEPKKVETNGGDLKRKQPEEQNHPSKSAKSSDKPSPSNRQGDGFKKPKNWEADCLANRSAPSLVMDGVCH
ncbi:hypothetical protein Bca4012_025452 [Brassica carinata]